MLKFPSSTLTFLSFNLLLSDPTRARASRMAFAMVSAYNFTQMAKSSLVVSSRTWRADKELTTLYRRG